MANGYKVYAPTREKQELLTVWRGEVSKRFERLVDAQIRAAEGVTHLVARDTAGRWAQVTDAQTMVEVLNSGTECFKLSAQAPSAPVLKDVFDRLFGQSTVNLDVSLTATPSQMSDLELRANLRDLLGRLDEPTVIDLEPVLGDGSGPAETLADPEGEGEGQL